MKPLLAILVLLVTSSAVANMHECVTTLKSTFSERGAHQACQYNSSEQYQDCVIGLVQKADFRSGEASELCRIKSDVNFQHCILSFVGSGKLTTHGAKRACLINSSRKFQECHLRLVQSGTRAVEAVQTCLVQSARR